MIYGKNEKGEKVKATKGGVATCFHCGEKLKAKCGEINTWHWSHLKSSNCDSLKSEMSQWHIDWQEKFPIENREVKVEYNGGYRIADVKLNNGLVIEFQHSSIPNNIMWEREKAHKNMIWILDNTSDYFRIYKQNNRQYFMTLTGFKKNFAYSNKPIYINFYGNLLYCPNTLNILKVVDGKTIQATEDDLPEGSFSYARMIVPEECIHEAIFLERKKSKIKKAIREGNELIETLKDKQVFDWFVKQYRYDRFKSICKNK